MLPETLVTAKTIRTTFVPLGSAAATTNCSQILRAQRPGGPQARKVVGGRLERYTIGGGGGGSASRHQIEGALF